LNAAEATLFLMEQQPAPPTPSPKPGSDEINFRIPFLRHPVPSWIYDIETLAFLEVNNAAIENYGYSHDEFLSMTIRDIRPAEDLPRLLEAVAVPESGKFYSGQWRHRLKSGKMIEVEVSSFRIEYGGRPASMVAALDVTDRNRTAETLRLSELRLRSLLDAFPYLVWLKDRDGKFVSVNQPFVDAFGQKSIADVAGKTDFDITNPELAAQYVADDIKVVTTGMKINVEEEIIDHHTRKWFETHKSPIFDDEGSIIGSAGFARDITERKLAEDELRQSEARFRALFEQAAVGVALVRIDTGRFVRVNQKLCALLGYTQEEMERTDFMAITHPDTLKADIANMNRLRAGEVRDFSSEKKYIRKNGTVIWADLTVSAMWAPGAPPDYCIGIIQDITARKQAERSLRQSEEKFRTAFFTSPDSISINRIADGMYISINKGFTLVTGYSEEDVRGRTSFEIDIWENPEDRKRLVEGLRKNGVVENIETRFRIKNGSILTGLVSASLIDIDGQQCHMLITRDITEHKKTEQLLHDVQRRESIGVLSSGIAHDFNNLLGIMMGNVSLAQTSLSEHHPAFTNLTKALSAMERAAELTRQILAYSGKGKFHIRTIDIAALVREHVSLFNISLPKNVKLVTELPSSPVLVNGDAAQIEQIVMNLIINGGEAIGERKGAVTVTLSQMMLTSGDLRPYGRITNTALKQGQYALLEVSDTGVGMSRETMDKIFDPFFTTKFTGRGLGLSAVMGIIRGHEGGIMMESTEGAGTTFRIALPICTAPIAIDDRLEEDSPSEAPLTTTVLIIDDEAEIAEIAKEMLEVADYTTIVSLNPLEAIEVYRKQRSSIGLVLLDLTMPEMSGKEVVETLQAIDPAVRIIISSGYTEEEVAKKIGALKAAAFIQKPYRLQSLLGLVKDVMQK
jgi:two-component system, cell cycle sensor histidine kinase and response regulator CckA